MQSTHTSGNNATKMGTLSDLYAPADRRYANFFTRTSENTKGVYSISRGRPFAFDFSLYRCLLCLSLNLFPYNACSRSLIAHSHLVRKTCANSHTRLTISSERHFVRRAPNPLHHLSASGGTCARCFWLSQPCFSSSRLIITFAWTSCFLYDISHWLNLYKYLIVGIMYHISTTYSFNPSALDLEFSKDDLSSIRKVAIRNTLAGLIQIILVFIEISMTC